jgi:hypothetical protein
MMRTFLGILLILGCFLVAWSCGKSEPVAEVTLRDAMQERMSEVLRIKEQIENNEPISPKEFTRFAGLPNSEFVDDVSEYQAYFDVFDGLYEQMFTAEDPRQHFNTIVQSCAACHTTVCPGPLRSIQRLEISEISL